MLSKLVLFMIYLLEEENTSRSLHLDGVVSAHQKVPAIPRTNFWKLFANAFYFILHRGPGP